MNRAQYSNDPGRRRYPSAVGALNVAINMMPMSVSMSCPPTDNTAVSDERIDPQDTRHPPMGRNGDAVVVQPSFDDAACRSKSPVGSLKNLQEWQARSPGQDAKEDSPEPRNPSSPPEQLEATSTLSRRHERNLSAHFFDATTLSRDDSLDPAFESALEDKFAGRKHRRMFSGEFTNPPLAHRRINSIGNSAAVQRPHRHHREHSAGLDILSAAADVSKDDFAAAAGVPMSRRRTPPPSLQQPHLQMEQPMRQLPPGQEFPPEGHHAPMHPPHPRSSYPLQASHYGAPPGAFHPPHGSQYSSYPPSSSTPSFYPPGYQSRPMSSHQAYPPQYGQRYPYRPEESNSAGFYDKKMATPPRQGWHQRHGPSNTQGSQTFVTAISVGHGNRAVNPTIASKDEVPSQVRHHRKMSSFSSLGSLPLGSVFSPSTADSSEHLKKGHHRASSSTVSFLNGIDDVGLESTDDTFLRNLQASNSAIAAGAAPVVPGSAKASASEPPEKLASGGTSKRVRRKCTIQGCQNRVVQGGLCISHGAKRKTCKHPGCSKNVKKAGLCSTHGPARKRCEADGCAKVAVQGGRCIAHGAKKRSCSMPDCTKQAILAGMCKKHHDQTQAQGQMCKEVTKSKKPTHTRGLSIFQEMSADAVGSILTDEPSQPPPQNPRIW